MRFAVGILMVGLCGCPPAGRPVDGRTEEWAGTCATDEQCPAGMVCEGCERGGQTCVPGWCELDPCRDVDDDCNGKADALDDAGTCRTCGPEQTYCGADRHCGPGSRCERGCCEPCGARRRRPVTRASVCCRGREIL
jgi:hypothetical protein